MFYSSKIIPNLSKYNSEKKQTPSKVLLKWVLATIPKEDPISTKHIRDLLQNRMASICNLLILVNAKIGHCSGTRCCEICSTRYRVIFFINYQVSHSVLFIPLIFFIHAVYIALPHQRRTREERREQQEHPHKNEASSSYQETHRYWNH